MKFESTENFARELDRQDALSKFRDRFYIPERNGQPLIYFCGNSLGLQPKSVPDALAVELKDWRELGVAGHLNATNPWFSYHKLLKPGLVELVGARDDSEVTAMGSLTNNLHLMMVSFYRPQQKRFKILMEKGAFPSDQYAVETQCRFHGLDPREAIVEVAPGPGSYTLSTNKILDTINELGETLALVLFSGVQYYTGQLFDIEAITRAGNQVGARVGWDMAHAVGNVPLELHRHQVDFAVWCSYKYLNSGPGGTSGIFVHQKHGENHELPRFAGWWGYPEDQRFEMKPGFKPTPGADGWQLSNANILSMAAQKASLELFMEAGITNIREKSFKLTGYLEYLLRKMSGPFVIITPENEQARGAQLSLFFEKDGYEVFKKLTDSGIVVDWREPGSIRMAPAPLYNTFQEVYNFCATIEGLLE